MTKNINNGGDPCMWCCFPCLVVWLSLEKCLQASCVCCCQILACDFKTTANQKVSNKSINEYEFTEIGINIDSIRSSNKDFIVSLVSNHVSKISDDEKKMLGDAVQEYKFVNDYEFCSTGKTKLIKYKDNDKINWTASINNQTMDIAEDWINNHKNKELISLIARYK